MALYRCVREPVIFGNGTKNFSHWKKTMINYLNILEIWDVVNKGYTLKFNTLITDSTNDIKVDSQIQTSKKRK